MLTSICLCICFVFIRVWSLKTVEFSVPVYLLLFLISHVNKTNTNLYTVLIVYSELLLVDVTFSRHTTLWFNVFNQSGCFVSSQIISRAFLSLRISKESWFSQIFLSSSIMLQILEGHFTCFFVLIPFYLFCARLSLIERLLTVIFVVVCVFRTGSAIYRLECESILNLKMMMNYIVIWYIICSSLTKYHFKWNNTKLNNFLLKLKRRSDLKWLENVIFIYFESWFYIFGKFINILY